MPETKKRAVYALEETGPVRFIRTQLDAAPRGAVSLREIAKDYRHSPAADLERVKLHENQASDTEARNWILRNAVNRLAQWLDVEAVDDDLLIAYKPDACGDDLRFLGTSVSPLVRSVFNSPFSPQRDFAENIRAVDRSDDFAELVESMRTFGWVEEFPAIVDERGVTIVGHRRLRAAEIAGVKPVTKTITFGSGDAADVQRVKLALASNLGGKALNARDRRKIALHLYRDEEWSLRRIGELLEIGKAQAGKDVHRALAETALALSPEETIGESSRKRGRRPSVTRDMVEPYFEAWKRGEISNTEIGHKVAAHLSPSQQLKMVRRHLDEIARERPQEPAQAPPTVAVLLLQPAEPEPAQEAPQAVAVFVEPKQVLDPPRCPTCGRPL
jgi:ParB-like chromosome segregation protein Spo0J